MSKLGIALVTFNRIQRAKQVIGRVVEYTGQPFELVIADDGSDDDTRSYFERIGVRVVSGRNRGVCWNKNRGLFALSALGCDTLLLMEDDIYPEKPGWEQDWIEATKRFDHLSFAHDKIAPQIIEGSGEPDDPYVNYKATAQCTSISSRALDAVGFLDTRFKGYGVGHAEWTSRIKAAGFGFKRVVLSTGQRARANLYIRGGLVADDAASFRNPITVEANKKLFQQLKSEPLLRRPWSSEAERHDFLNEQTEAGIDFGRLVDGFDS